MSVPELAYIKMITVGIKHPLLPLLEPFGIFY
jgi:hypothetical protein